MAFEILARRHPIWLFSLVVLAVAGMGLAFAAFGLVFGWAFPVYAGLGVAAPFGLLAALIVAAAQFVPRKSAPAAKPQDTSLVESV